MPSKRTKANKQGNIANNKKVKLVDTSNLHKSIDKNLPLKKAILLSFILSISVITFVLLVQDHLPPQIPLFYGLPEGEDQLSKAEGLMVPGLISLAVSIVNTTIAYLITKPFLKKTLILGSLSVSLFSVITSLKIAFLVGSF